MCERTIKWIRVYGQMDGWAKRIDYSHAHARIAVIKRSVFFASNLSREKNARKEIVLVCIHAFASFIHFNVLSLTLRHQYERECLRALFVNNCNVVVVPFSKTGSIFSFTSMVFLSFPRHDMTWICPHTTHVPSTPFVSFIAKPSTNERIAQTNWDKKQQQWNATKTYFLKWFQLHFLIFPESRSRGHQRSQFHLSRTFREVPWIKWLMAMHNTSTTPL